MSNKCYIFVFNLNILLKFIFISIASLGRQHHARITSPVHNRGKRPSILDSQRKTFQKRRRDMRPNWTLLEILALVDAKRE